MSEPVLPPFEDCFRALFPYLVSVAYRLTCDLAASEDLAEEALLVGYRHWPAFEPQGIGPYRAYLRKVTWNLVRKHFKRELRRRVREGEYWRVLTLLGGTNGMSQAMARSTRSETDTLARRVLTEEEYHVLALQSAGKTIREMEASIGKPRSTLHDIGKRALAKLRKALKPEAVAAEPEPDDPEAAAR